MVASDDPWRRKALRWLMRRDYSKAELLARLTTEGADAATATALLADFEAEGWLCDARVAGNHLLKHRQRDATDRLRAALLQRGIAEPVIDAALAASPPDESPQQQAERLRREKFGAAMATLPTDIARQIRFLHQRGFDDATIAQVVKLPDDLRGYE